MYQVIEYQDYRKENYIYLHGVTSDLEKAKDRAKSIQEQYASKHYNKDHKGTYCRIQERKKGSQNDYVDFQGRDRKSVICEFEIFSIEFHDLLEKTIRELFVDILDEKVPKDISPDEIITTELFCDLIDRNLLKGYLEFLAEDQQLISLTRSSGFVAVVTCEEF